MNPKVNTSIRPDLFTVGEVARLFRCDPKTVKRQARAGKLPGFKFGKSWFFRLEDINSMIDDAIHATCGVQA